MRDPDIAYTLDDHDKRDKQKYGMCSKDNYRYGIIYRTVVPVGEEEGSQGSGHYKHYGDLGEDLSDLFTRKCRSKINEYTQITQV